MRTPAQYVRGVRHPEGYHGRGRRGGYFEGWYVKLISADRTQRWAVIPGLFRSDDGSSDEAFVQVLDGLAGRSWFHSFPVASFSAAEDRFDVAVGGCRFDDSGIELDLPGLRGRVSFASPLQPYPVTVRAPGIMGWFGYVPVMECFHGIVSFGHDLAGVLDVDGVPRDFSGGRGYIEKDWGRSFPAGYVWLAGNHLVDADGHEVEASLQASCAIIPGLGRTFRGSIVALQTAGGIATWATWNGSHDTGLHITDGEVSWSMRGPAGQLDLRAERVRGGLLHAPLRTAMHRRVEETLDATVQIRHTARDGSTVFAGEIHCAGMEVFGDMARLMRL